MSGKTLSISAALILLGSAATAYAQSPFSISFGGGPSIPTNPTGARFNNGFNLSAGVGFHPSRAAGIMAEFGYFDMGINRNALDRIGVPGGNGRIISATLNPMIHLMPKGRVDAYLIGGAGYYRRTIEFTKPSSAIRTAFDPYYGIFFPLEVPTTSVLGSFSQNRTGINGGMGLSIRLGEDKRSSFYAESRYHYIFTSPVRTSMIPVTFGFRW